MKGVIFLILDVTLALHHLVATHLTPRRICLTSGNMKSARKYSNDEQSLAVARSIEDNK